MTNIKLAISTHVRLETGEWVTYKDLSERYVCPVCGLAPSVNFDGKRHFPKCYCGETKVVELAPAPVEEVQNAQDR